MAAAGIDLADLYASALAVVQREVPFEQGCWAGVDPDSMAMTSISNWQPWPVSSHQFEEYFLRFAQSEYTGREPNTFVELLRRPLHHDLPAGEVGGHAPLHRLFGVGDDGVDPLADLLEDRPRERLGIGDIGVDAWFPAQLRSPSLVG